MARERSAAAGAAAGDDGAGDAPLAALPAARPRARISSDSGSALRSMQELSYARTRARRAVRKRISNRHDVRGARCRSERVSALPRPAAVAAMQADPTRLAKILARIDAEISRAASGRRQVRRHLNRPLQSPTAAEIRTLSCNQF